MNDRETIAGELGGRQRQGEGEETPFDVDLSPHLVSEEVGI